MKKCLLLALPMLSLVVAGCCATGTCSPCTASVDSPAVVAEAVRAPATTKVAKGEKILTEAEYQKLLAEGRVTRIGETPAKTETVKPATPARTRTVAVIPTVKLPEGWSYIRAAEVVPAPVKTEEKVATVQKESSDS